MIAIIVSKKDLAGLNIKDNLIQLGFNKTDTKFDNSSIYNKDNINLYTLDRETIHSENLDKEINADLFIFATRHRSQSGTKTLCCHFPGNWDKAEHGGQEKQLNIAPSLLLKKAFLNLKQLTTEDYDVTMEATHHGPLIQKPCMFIEIGSEEQQWQDPNAGKIIAQTILNTLKTPDFDQHKVAIGLGGNHYCANFNKKIETNDIAMSHVCPKHNLEHLDESLLKQAIEKTLEKVDFILLDWKGLGPHKQKLLEMIKNLNLEYKRSDQLK